MLLLKRIMSALLILIALGGCAGQSHQLLGGDGNEVVVGAFTRGGTGKPSMVVDLGGKRYEAQGFAIHRTQNLAGLGQRYGFGSKHYQGIAAGLDSDHYFYVAEPRLRSPDGLTIQCSVAWRGGTLPVGTCELESGERFNIRAR